ncbi:MAG: ZIP family metal transporter [Candidatus Micrarchaeota archaeon]
MDAIFGALTVLLATSAGALAVLFFGCLKGTKDTALLSFSAGVMAYASIEMLSESYELSGALPMIAGFLIGIAALTLSERALPHVHQHITKKELEHTKKKALMIGGAIAIHNIPEGLAIATAFASSVPLGWFVTTTMAIQDVPEGTLISAPLLCYGMKKSRAILFGVLSGLVEAAAAIAGFMFLSIFTPLIPIALAFSAGAMAFVVMVELLPDAFGKGHERVGALAFIGGAVVAFAIASLLSA